ncbi:type IV secretion protein Rhs [Pseudomonas sp. 14P_8.1_Bac3]|uniref:RHS repeat domain-containing protein n=1 Tax=Pseudomonas sp. 14P_8.1_Bac3 TaxID=2971621 RepID=UPI0021CACA7D|nr:RHS repeat-associated core domain-containing protein [Pseudomonas sp. 14P_8.1_Bac3]MCU1763733.1 type IV secretion protein Rhs [Pseudomonas sp. 14P_8.1_Bac3]
MPDSSTVSAPGSPETLHSNAFNFGEFLTGGVDPRTGLYTCALTLGELVSCFLQGPSLPIRLFFSPLHGSDSGFGKGWALALTRYDVVSGLLTLSGGQRYRARQTASGLVFEELKLHSLNVLCPGPGRFNVVHKSGLTEELEIYAGSDLAVPRRIMSANGAAVTLDYQVIDGKPVLSAVRDASRALLKIARPSGQVTLTLYPDSECAATFTLKLESGRVTSVQLPDGSAWSLKSEAVDGVECLTEVTSPLGARALIGYKAAGHRLPLDGPHPTIPHVISHTVFPGQQPAITTNYAFSQTNFLGHDGDQAHWSQGGDTLLQSPSTYQYSSTEMLMNGATVHRSIKRTYNHCHLLISQVTTCGHSEISRTIEYHLEPGKPFSEQPPQCHLPRVQTLRYENLRTKAFREEVTTTEFDAWGNLLKHVAPNGLITESEFYPVSGAEGCPADPLGFVRFEKKRTVRPAAEFAQASTTQTNFSYQQVGATGKPGSDVVLAQQAFYECTTEGDILRSQTDFEYARMNAGDQAYVVLQKQIVRQNGEASLTRFEYRIDDLSLAVETLQIGFDDTRKTSTVTFSTINGLKRSEQNEDQGKVVFSYDVLGREFSKTVAPDTRFESRCSSRFHVENKGAQTRVTKLSKDANHLQTRSRYDGLGRIIEIEEQDPDQLEGVVFREVYAAKYNALGQLTGEKRIDRWHDQRRVFTTTFAFDEWGQVNTTLNPDGRREHCDHDPVTRTETAWREGMGKSVTVYNAFGKPDSIELFDTSSKSQGKQLYTYDGLGRSVSQIDAVGNRTTYAYDVFNRLILSTLPDGSAVQTSYAQHCQEPLPINITVAGRTLGQQVFDGLGRLTLSTVGERTTRTGYKGGFSQPAWKQMPGGQRIEYHYEPALGGVVTRRQTSGLLATYNYHPQLGELTQCVEQGRESQFEYDRAGRLKREASTVGADEKAASYTYSLGGRPLSCIDVLGETHATDYDDAGRPRSFKHRALNATFSYNTLGQLMTIDTRAAKAQRSLVTRLAYDDFGREVSRTFELGGGVTQVLSSTYTLANKLAQKTLKQDQQVLRSERFTYDCRGRLSLYECEGTQRPRDAQGKEIRRQRYVFDALDNILTLETEFPDGVNLATFEYLASDPTQLTNIRNSHPDYPAPAVLRYDPNGHLIEDEQRRKLAYDPLGRFTQVTDATDEVIRTFYYDARDQLVELSQPSGPATRRFYQKGRHSNEIRGARKRTLLRSAGVLLGQDRQGSDAAIRLFGVDQQHSVLAETLSGQRRHFAYSPYGHRAAPGSPGFSGEQLDPQTGLYLLGNGYRGYSPTLMRFISPDSVGPFAAGGLNPYAYCAGDPINRIDPTGHFWEAILSGVLSVVGIVASVLTLGAATPLAIAGLALGVASGVIGTAGAALRAYDPESEAAEILDWVSLGLGAGSLAAGMAAAGKASVQWGNRLNKAFSNGLSPNGPPSAAAVGSKGAAKVSDGFRGNGPWRIKLADPKSISKQLKRAQQGEYDSFKNAIYHEGVNPAEAARHMGDPKPTFLQSHTKNWKDALGNKVNKVDQWEVRIGGADRVTYLVDDTDKLVTIQQVGGHL